MLTGPDDHAKALALNEAKAGVDAGLGQDRGSRAGPGRWINWPTWLVLAGYLAAAFVVTWRLWADPATRTVAGNAGDADLFAWYMRYAAHAIAHWQLPALATTALNAPSGINVMWNSSLLLPSILFAPVTLLFGAQVSLTVLTTLGFAGSAAAMFWVLRRWQVSGPAAALAGALYGFSPALLQSALGHYDLQLAVLPPLIVHAMLRIAIGPRPGPVAPPEVPGPGAPPGPVAPPAQGAPPEPAVSAEVSAGRGRPLTGLRSEVRSGIWLGLLVTAEIFVSEELALTTVLTGALLIAILGTGFGRQALAG